MHRPPAPPLLEEMGLRLENTRRLGALDACLLVALFLSGAGWVGVSLVGVAPDRLAALASPAGRAIAGALGLATVVAVVRAAFALWPFGDDERSLL